MNVNAVMHPKRITTIKATATMVELMTMINIGWTVETVGGTVLAVGDDQVVIVSGSITMEYTGYSSPHPTGPLPLIPLARPEQGT